MTPFFVIVSIAIVFAIISIAYRIDYNNHENFVRANSFALKKLNETNSKYSFHNHVNFDMSHTYDNENFFNQISCQDYLIYQLQFHQRDISQQIKKINSNREKYKSYTEEINSINQFGKYTLDMGKLKLEKLIKIEEKLFKHSIIHPQTQFALSIVLYCSKINGDVYKKKNQQFNADEIYALIKQLNNKRGYFFNDKNVWDAICRVERGKVSNKMRFSIYQRDGYRCRRCGVAGKYATLEIDHIVPIAKGGKSTYNNLQTLCHRCNVNKGDSLSF